MADDNDEALNAQMRRLFARDAALDDLVYEDDEEALAAEKERDLEEYRVAIAHSKASYRGCDDTVDLMARAKHWAYEHDLSEKETRLLLDTIDLLAECCHHEPDFGRADTN